MKKSNQGISSGLGAIVAFIIIIIVIVGIAAALSGALAPAAPNPVAVELDSVPVTANYSIPQLLEWGPTTPGNTYTKNLTVTNNGVQNLTLKLFTTEPIGTMQSWAPNNTQLNPLSTVSSTLTLTLSSFVGTGSYTWRLLAVNGSAPIIEPEPEPDPDIPIQVTIQAENGVENVTFTNDLGDTIILTNTMLPITFNFTRGDDLTFQTSPKLTYTFNTWLLSDGTFRSDNPVTLVKVNATLTVTALYNAP